MQHNDDYVKYARKELGARYSKMMKVIEVQSQNEIFTPIFGLNDKLNLICWACDWYLLDVLQLCHIKAKSHGGSNNPDNFIILCGTCHEESPDGFSLEDQIKWCAARDKYGLRHKKSCLGIKQKLEKLFKNKNILNNDSLVYKCLDQYSIGATKSANKSLTAIESSAWFAVEKYLDEMKQL